MATWEAKKVETTHWRLSDGRLVAEKRGTWFLVWDRSDGVRRFDTIRAPDLTGAQKCDPPPSPSLGKPAPGTGRI